MKTRKLYICGTAWEYERDTTMQHELRFYTTPEALKEENPCWKECGIAEIDPQFIKYQTNPTQYKAASFVKQQKEESIFIPIATELIKLSRATGSVKLAESALKWALDTLKHQRKQKKRKMQAKKK